MKGKVDIEDVNIMLIWWNNSGQRDIMSTYSDTKHFIVLVGIS